MGVGVRLLVKLFLVCSTISSCWASDLEDFNVCCNHCKADQDLWVSFSPAWNLTIEGNQVLDFQDAPSVLTNDDVVVRIKVLDHDYYIRYGGAAVIIKYPDILTQANAIRDEQYLETNLESMMDVAGVVIQAGFYEDEGVSLLYRKDTWVTEFAVSYAGEDKVFDYIYDDGGSVKIFSGNSDSYHTELVGFDDPIVARYIRVHPLKGVDISGDEVTLVLFRLTVITCSIGGTCNSPRVNCVLNEWQAWSECECQVEEECQQWRERTVAHYAACGGVQCEPTKESKACVIPDPLWKMLLLYILIALLIFTIILVCIICIVIRIKKRKKDKVIFEKPPPKKVEKEKTPRELRKDAPKKEDDAKIDDVDDEKKKNDEYNEFDESVLTARKVRFEEPIADDPAAEDGGKKKKKTKGKKGKEVAPMDGQVPDIREEDGLYVTNKDEQKPPEPTLPDPVEPKSKDALNDMFGPKKSDLPPLRSGASLAPIGGKSKPKGGFDDDFDVDEALSEFQ